MSVVRYDPGSTLLLEGAEHRVLRIEDLDQLEVENVETKARRIVPVSEFSSSSEKPLHDLAAISEEHWRVAQAREPTIRALSLLPKRRKEDVRKAAQELGLGVSQTYLLLQRYDANPALTSLVPTKPGLKEGRSVLSESTEEVIAQAIDQYYATRKRPKIQDLVEEVKRRCAAAGLPAPARNTITRRVAARPALEMVRRRYSGRKARALGPTPGSFPGGEAPFSSLQFDHTQVDIIVVDEVTREPLGRPWLTLGIDVFSRMVAGFHLSMLPPSTVSVGLAVTHAVLPKESDLERYGITTPWPVCGLPGKIHVDNGKEFRSDAFKRGCAQYGIGLEYRPVKTPHYGGHIERLIGTFMGKVHLLPGTTFSNVQEKDVADPKKTAAYTLAELEEWLMVQIVEVYHRTKHRGIGEVPLARWERGILGTRDVPGRGLLPRVADAKRFFIDFLPASHRRVRQQGIVWDHVWYWSDALRPLVDEQSVLVRRDPRDLSRLYMIAPDGADYLEVPYANLTRRPISLWEHRRARQLLQQESSPFLDEEAIFRAVDRLNRLEVSAREKTRAARRRPKSAPSPPAMPTLPAPAAEHVAALPPPSQGPTTGREKRRFDSLQRLTPPRHKP